VSGQKLAHRLKNWPIEFVCNSGASSDFARKSRIIGDSASQVGQNLGRPLQKSGLCNSTGMLSKSLYHKDLSDSDGTALRLCRCGVGIALISARPRGEVAMTENTSEQMSVVEPEPRLGRSVSLDHAAEMLGVSRRTIYNRIREGRLVTIRTLGGSQRVLLDSVQDSKQS